VGLEFRAQGSCSPEWDTIWKMVFIFDLRIYPDIKLGFPHGGWVDVLTLLLLQRAWGYGVKLPPVYPSNPWESWEESRLPSLCC